MNRMFPDFLPAMDNEVDYLFPATTAADLLADLQRLVPTPQPAPTLPREMWLAHLARAEACHAAPVAGLVGLASH